MDSKKRGEGWWTGVVGTENYTIICFKEALDEKGGSDSLRVTYP
jgi:hypothetical protein